MAEPSIELLEIEVLRETMGSNMPTTIFWAFVKIHEKQQATPVCFHETLLIENVSMNPRMAG